MNFDKKVLFLGVSSQPVIVFNSKVYILYAFSNLLLLLKNAAILSNHIAPSTYNDQLFQFQFHLILERIHHHTDQNLL